MCQRVVYKLVYSATFDWFDFAKRQRWHCDYDCTERMVKCPIAGWFFHTTSSGDIPWRHDLYAERVPAVWNVTFTQAPSNAPRLCDICVWICDPLVSNLSTKFPHSVHNNNSRARRDGRTSRASGTCWLFLSGKHMLNSISQQHTLGLS